MTSILRSNAPWMALLLAGCSQAVPAQAQSQRILLSPLESTSQINKGAYQMSDLAVRVAPAPVGAKVGPQSLLLEGGAKGGGAKGDFTLAGAVPGEVKTLGIWVYLAPDANVSDVGFQVYDAQGEGLIWRQKADWTGWKWIEWDLQAQKPAQAWAQGDKNSALDFPLKDVHFVWFAKGAGLSSVGVDGLAAQVEGAPMPALPLQMQGEGGGWIEPGQTFSAPLVITNFGAQKQATTLQYSIQRVSQLSDVTPPDPIFGSDHALGAKSWTEVEGKIVEEGSLTDGKDWTTTRPGFKENNFKGSEAFQFVDLGVERRITRLEYLSGDANWAWKVDVSASADGKNYTPVEGLQNVDFHGKWGRQTLPVATPFSARFLRFRSHKGGELVGDFAMPSALFVYDGAADESLTIPKWGEEVASGTLQAEIAPRDFATLEVKAGKPLSTGAYIVALRLQSGDKTQLVWNPTYVLPAPMNRGTRAQNYASRFGINSAATRWNPSHERLGIGWVRFENMKWQMLSDAPDVYKYDGSIGPWNVNADQLMAEYNAQGLNVLPFLFQTPDYASSAPADVNKGRWNSYPPKDNAQMADFVFQTVARFGSQKHDPKTLKTSDKQSGTNKINVFEIWNEPNLQAPSWGPWVGTTAQYLDMFRPAAEAVKKADPKALVTNGGYAGIEVSTVDALRAHTYPDGKRPLDFVDILNVHYYSGRVAPEIATVDTNVDRSGKKEGARTYEESLQRLVAWRDQHKPGIPIWLTETGYDSGGSYGTNETTQAARLPRVIMLSLANGMDKVFVYRESGSTPSQHAASGLFRNDGSLKPSWLTYATLIRELDGTSSAGRLNLADQNARLYAWNRGTETILSAWAIDGKANLDLKLGACTVTDAFGNTRQENLNGNFALSPFPVYIRKIGNLAPVKSLLEAAQTQKLAQKRERERLSKARAYLFDFGSRDKVGFVDVGNTRAFTPVLAADTYDETRGWGFTPTAAASDGVRGWINDPLETDSTRMHKGQAFRFRVTPGQYRLQIAGESVGGQANLTIKGAQDGDKTLTLKRGAENSLASLDLEITGDSLTLESNDYVDVRWLSLIEKM